MIARELASTRSSKSGSKLSENLRKPVYPEKSGRKVQRNQYQPWCQVRGKYDTIESMLYKEAGQYAKQMGNT